MASVTKADIPKESEFMTLFWRMIKEFYIPEDDDAYWTALIDRADQIDKACGHSELGKKLLLAFMDYLDEEWKKERKTDGRQDSG